MTSLIAWAGMDPHGQSSLYFATDSRISWSVDPPFWDLGRKVFACRSAPDLFAFTGDGLFAVTVISRLCTLIDDGLVNPAERSSLTTRCQWVSNMVQQAHEAYPKKCLGRYVIFYGTRIGEGTKPDSKARQKAAMRPDFDPLIGSWFGCQTIAWDGANLASEYLETPHEHSQHIAADGTGKKWIEGHQTRVADDPQSRTSRIIFRAFCDALRAAEDRQSGGAPQLVGLYRSGPAKTFGIFSQAEATFLGLNVRFSGADVEWRNEDFERVTETGTLIANAKQHRFGYR
jgi:hypothetical protein